MGLVLQRAHIVSWKLQFRCFCYVFIVLLYVSLVEVQFFFFFLNFLVTLQSLHFAIFISDFWKQIIFYNHGGFSYPFTLITL